MRTHFTKAALSAAVISCLSTPAFAQTSDQDIETFKKVLSSIIVNLEDEKDKPS